MLHAKRAVTMARVCTVHCCWWVTAFYNAVGLHTHCLFISVYYFPRCLSQMNEIRDMLSQMEETTTEALGDGHGGSTASSNVAGEASEVQGLEAAVVSGGGSEKASGGETGGEAKGDTTAGVAGVAGVAAAVAAAVGVEEEDVVLVVGGENDVVMQEKGAEEGGCGSGGGVCMKAEGDGVSGIASSISTSRGRGRSKVKVSERESAERRAKRRRCIRVVIGENSCEYVGEA